ncbi:MAG: endolytic transglycosylase MltG [Candidatus Stahlbacteria bacterium]|nr:endolytic transglycosylase MltG [Candidatus Stahlbacteria bacterium]
MWILIFCLINTDTMTQSSMVSVKIKRGESLAQITSKLYSANIIKHPFWFKVRAKITGNENKIKAGYYVFNKSTSIRKVLWTLISGKSVEVRVMIPEGATIKEIVDLLAGECDIDTERFKQLVYDTIYVRKLGIESPSLEGYLFPETYLIPYADMPEEIIPRMVRQFFSVFTPEMKERAKKVGLKNMEEAVILASIIEKEAVCEKEKPIISGVYHKRLKSKLFLQCDATIQYILPNRKPNLTYSDLKIQSPYNTYLHRGLPPTPIASPGKSSIIAALWPEKTDYLYFVARGNGTHIFSKTLAQHNIEKSRVKNQK